MKDYETDEPAWIHEDQSTQVTQKQKKWFTIFMLIAVPFCLWAGWFEFGRAEHGNWRAWVYTFEWPFFGGLAIYLWRRLMKGDVPKIPRPDFAALAKADESVEGKPDHAANADGDQSDN